MKIVTLDQVRSAVFRPSDAERVGLLHPEMRWRCVAWLNMLKAGKLPVWITHTLRSWKEQEALYAIGRAQRTDGSWYETRLVPVVTHATAGNSWHNYGLAFDFCLVGPDGKSASWDIGADYDRDGQPDWAEVGEAGESLGMEWGMRWSAKKRDGDHFEYHPDLSLEMAWGMSVSKQPIPDDYFAKRTA